MTDHIKVREENETDETRKLKERLDEALERNPADYVLCEKCGRAFVAATAPLVARSQAPGGDIEYARVCSECGGLSSAFRPSMFGVRGHLKKYPLGTLDGRTRVILREQARREYDQAKRFYRALSLAGDDIREASVEVASLSIVMHLIERSLECASFTSS